MNLDLFARKHRWVFSAQSVEGKLTFPEGFVKTPFPSSSSSSPFCSAEKFYSRFLEECASKIPSTNSSLKIVMFFALYDQPGEAFEVFDKFRNRINLQESFNGKLRLYDDCGTLQGFADLEDINIKFLDTWQIDFSVDEIIAEWEINYAKCEWKRV